MKSEWNKKLAVSANIITNDTFLKIVFNFLPAFSHFQENFIKKSRKKAYVLFQVILIIYYLRKRLDINIQTFQLVDFCWDKLF